MTPPNTKKKPIETQQDERRKSGWQARKSAMTRRTILEAAIQCIIDHGYARTTTSLIADQAIVSRGAMTHHFPSRSAVLTATIEYLHKKRLKEYRALMKESDIPSRLTAREQIAAVVDVAWQYSNLPSSVAYEEILMASRTDPELKRVLKPLEKEFEDSLLKLVKGLFPRWEGREELETAHHAALFLLNGMNLSHMRTRKRKRTRRILEFLTDSVENLYRKVRSDIRATGS